MTFAEKIKEIKLKLDLNQEEMAKLFDTTQSSICRWMNGRGAPTILNQNKFDNMISIIRDEKVMRAVTKAKKSNDGLAAVSALLGLFNGYLKIANVGYDSLKPILEPGTILYDLIVVYSQLAENENREEA